MVILVTPGTGLPPRLVWASVSGLTVFAHGPAGIPPSAPSISPSCKTWGLGERWNYGGIRKRECSGQLVKNTGFALLEGCEFKSQMWETLDWPLFLE